eukprot:9988615-Alexandrium_andersonii.AAC.1
MSCASSRAQGALARRRGVAHLPLRPVGLPLQWRERAGAGARHPRERAFGARSSGHVHPPP